MRHVLFRVLLASVFLSGFAQAQEYPSKPINLLVGYPAGGSTDLSMRALAAEAAKILKQPIVISNVEAPSFRC
jgi:tripartite-type tricarboxylate transporter receptor subunit TctC